MLGGSTGLVRQSRGVFSGDLSGIEASAMPGWARLRYFPPRDLESIADWQIKIDRFAERSLDEEITAVVGTPNWLLIFFERLAEVASARRGGRANRIADIYPALELLTHGGVAWAPYRDRFAALLEGSRAETREVYPASEGFFAIADRSATARACGFCSIPGSFTSSSPSISWAARSLTAAGSATSSRA